MSFPIIADGSGVGYSQRVLGNFSFYCKRKDMWTIVQDKDSFEKAYSLAKGCYQRNLLDGIENLSGSSLRGKAKHWGYKYRVSRENLIERIRAAGVTVGECKGIHNRRLLVIG